MKKLFTPFVIFALVTIGASSNGMQKLKRKHDRKRIEKQETKRQKMHKEGITCKGCNYWFATNEILKDHQKDGCKAEEFPCKKCKKKFPNKRLWDIHQSVTSCGPGKDRQDIPPAQPQPYPHLCNDCDERFSTERGLRCHAARMHPQKETAVLLQPLHDPAPFLGLALYQQQLPLVHASAPALAQHPLFGQNMHPAYQPPMPAPIAHQQPLPQPLPILPPLPIPSPELVLYYALLASATQNTLPVSSALPPQLVPVIPPMTPQPALPGHIPGPIHAFPADLLPEMLAPSQQPLAASVIMNNHFGGPESQEGKDEEEATQDQDQENFDYMSFLN